MKILKGTLDKIKRKLVSAAEQSVLEEVEDGLTTEESFRKMCRRAAAEGCVLLKNEDFFPIREESVALFGRCQIDTFYGGYGSGGDIRAPYYVSIAQGMRENGLVLDEEIYRLYEDWTEKNRPQQGTWGSWPLNYPEMPVEEKLIEEAAGRCKKAIMVIGRASGEDRENLAEKGGWYLTEEERDILLGLRRNFSKVGVLFNCGSIMDTFFVQELMLDGAMYVWQGGQEMGNGVFDVVSGRVSPSGRLTDTIAPLEEYPSTPYFGGEEYNNYTEDIYVGYRYFETFAEEKVLYPFGFGLSYTTFSTAIDAVDDTVIAFQVTNTGKVKGRQVIQIYVSAPQGQLGKPKRICIDFVKTRELAPGESERFTRKIDWRTIASYDDTGESGYRNAWVLEAGTYRFFMGEDVRSAQEIYACNKKENILLEQCEEACPPEELFGRIVNKGGQPVAKQAPTRQTDKAKRILAHMPEEIPCTQDKGIRLEDVAEYKNTLEEFVAQLTIEEMEALTRGSLEGMGSSLGPKGNAGVFGGVEQSLREKGIVPIAANDGPSGVRLQAHTTLMPIGTALASSFDTHMVRMLAAELGREMKSRGGMVLLAPGMNIHRHPLCGRNFEYFSEDPVVSGKIAAAYVNGVQDVGASATVKHFACNNQENMRMTCDSRVSQRALREIYLKGFELCIRESNPHCLMTSYNKINGEWSCYNYELVTQILRREWGYEGCVMTDWWIVRSKCAYFEGVRDQAYRVRAQVDVFMPGADRSGRYKGKVDGSIAEAVASSEGITLGELQRCACNVLRLCLKYI